MKKIQELTVGMLKEKLKDVPDDLPVKLSSDSGIDQGTCGGEVVVTDAWRHTFKLPKGEIFDDTGEDHVDEFHIYCNEYSEEELEEEE